MPLLLFIRKTSAKIKPDICPHNEMIVDKCPVFKMLVTKV
jgi:hypothetical protein